MTLDRVTPVLADAVCAPFWTDRPEAPARRAPAVDGEEADLIVIGAGFTGLWTAWQAMRRNPRAHVLVLDSEQVGYGASGRNGGFVAASITHGLAHGEALWPEDMPRIVGEGQRNLEAIESDLRAAGIECDFRRVGKTTLAVRPWQVAALREAHALSERHSERSEFQDREVVQADVHSPTYLAGLRVHGSTALVDPALMAWGMATHLESLGVVIRERSRVVNLRREGTTVRVELERGATLNARSVVVATAAYRAPLRRLSNYIMPLYDHVLTTEPLTTTQRTSIGWTDGQGLTDAGNQFHYYRLTADGRILWGGWDAVYHRGGRVHPDQEYRSPGSHALLARQFAETFPQLEGVRFSHRWSGPIDSTTRFTAAYGTALDGRVAYAVGHTGLGVGAARFSADVALDLLAGEATDRTRYGIVRRKPFPIPPEPLRDPIIQFTRRSIIAADTHEGRRNLWLRTLDRFGLGFNS